MSSATTKCLKKNNGAPAIIEHVLGIIDSKIQYIDYQTNQAIQSCTNPVYNDCTEEELEVLIATETFAKDDNKVLDHIESYSKNISLLLVIRTKLNQLNAFLAFELLSRDNYLTYSEKVLRRLMDGTSLDQRNLEFAA